MWEKVKQPLGDEEEAPKGPMVDWVRRIQDKLDRESDAYADAKALADLRALRNGAG